MDIESSISSIRHLQQKYWDLEKKHHFLKCELRFWREKWILDGNVRAAEPGSGLENLCAKDCVEICDTFISSDEPSLLLTPEKRLKKIMKEVLEKNGNP